MIFTRTKTKPLFKNPFKDSLAETALDENPNLVEILRRYDSAIRALVLRGYYKLLEKEVTHADVGKNIQNSLIDRCVVHAFNGAEHINAVQGNLQYTVLQAALIVTITANIYINPPVTLDSSSLNDALSALSGFAAFTHLLCIINCTIAAGALSMAYSEVDKLIAYHNTQIMVGWTMTMNYLAVTATVFMMLIAGYDRSNVNIAVQLYALAVVVVLLITFIAKISEGARLQDQRILLFYQKYCDISGELKDDYLKLIREEKKDNSERV